MQRDVMTTRERFQAVMSFKPFDRLPVVEWAPWWDETINPWFEEGLPRSLMSCDGSQLNRYFGMDIYELTYVLGLSAVPKGREKDMGAVGNIDDYRRARQHMYPWPIVDRD